MFIISSRFLHVSAGSWADAEANGAPWWGDVPSTTLPPANRHAQWHSSTHAAVPAGRHHILALQNNICLISTILTFYVFLVPGLSAYSATTTTTATAAVSESEEVSSSCKTTARPAAGTALPLTQILAQRPLLNYPKNCTAPSTDSTL